MKGLDFYFGRMLADYLDQPNEPEPEPAPCVYCRADTDQHDDCTNPNCPER
jgi:hypothetical protein